MKNILLILVLLFTASCANCGELQQQFDNEKTTKHNLFKKKNAFSILKKDLKNYNKSRSIYGELIYLISNSDETNYRYLEKVRKNFDNCSDNLKCWNYIEIDDYYYSWLDEPTRHIIWFNNMVFLNK